MLNPELCLIEQQSAANTVDVVYECVCDWVNVKLYCKELWVVIKTRKELYKYKTIYHLKQTRAQEKKLMDKKQDFGEYLVLQWLCGPSAGCLQTLKWPSSKLVKTSIRSGQR